MTQLIRADSSEPFEQAVTAAIGLLSSGKLVALPTETVYGLAANALDSAAVSEIYRVKGRPSVNPIIVHVSSVEMARSCVSHWPEAAGKLASAFWPGPLTLVLPRAGNIPDVVTAGGRTVGVRMPAHPVFLEVVRRCGFPIAAPSANPANRVSPTTAQHVLDYFSDVIPLVVDGGPAHVGIESTVVDLTVTPARVLRPGMIDERALNAVIETDGANVANPQPDQLKSPGQLLKHYAPKAMLRQWPSACDASWLEQSTRTPPHKTGALCHTRVPPPTVARHIKMLPREASAYARALYSELHSCDALSLELIWVEEPPGSQEWHGIRDRLTRAASSSG